MATKSAQLITDAEIAVTQDPAQEGVALSASAPSSSSFELPDEFNLGKAAAMVGMSNAQSLLDEVMIVAVGDMTNHAQQGISIKGLQAAADDVHNSQRATARQTLNKITKILQDASTKAQKS